VVISFGLSVKEIEAAIKEVKTYKRDLNYKVKRFAELLAEEGLYIARTNIAEYNAIYSGELIESIKTEFQGSSETGSTWIIYTDNEHAKYIEFGFGFIGSSSPHPKTSVIGWKYDINKHGEKGWFYMKDGEWHWSNGQPSKPFMYMTARDLKMKVNDIAKIVFR